ncbi:hypothetical protein NR798_39085 [Archangium gephyra]|uniref:hypothetical protein n=1 Tax=Archangium gephyra TaxID=48 RepID=UPI0035D43753
MRSLMVRLIALPLVALALLMLPTEAQGSCGFPSAGALLTSDVHPMRARVYLFVIKGRRRPVYEAKDSQGRLIPITWRTMSESLNFDVYRLEFRPMLPGVVVLSSPEEPGRTTGIVVSERWKPEAPDVPVRILEQDFSYVDGCPYEHTRDLFVSLVAPLYRVTFASSREDYLAGRTRSLLIPGRADSRDGVKTGRGLVQLGDIACFSDSFDWKKEPVFLGVTALLADGSETPLPAEPVRVEPPPKPERMY